MQSERMTFWFVAMLYIGVLLRLLGFLPSREFDRDEDETDGDENPELVKQRILAIRRVARGMFVMASKIDPKLAIRMTFFDDDGKPLPGYLEAQVMIEQFLSGEYQDAPPSWDANGLFSTFDQDTSSVPIDSKADTEYASTGLPQVYPDWIPNETGQVRVQHALNKSKYQSLSGQVFQFLRRIVQCKCGEYEYHNRSFPFEDCRSPRVPADDFRYEIESLAFVLVDFHRLIRSKGGTCGKCHSQILKYPGFEKYPLLFDAAPKYEQRVLTESFKVVKRNEIEPWYDKVQFSFLLPSSCVCDHNWNAECRVCLKDFEKLFSNRERKLIGSETDEWRCDHPG